jgi:hypothetical protein
LRAPRWARFFQLSRGFLELAAVRDGPDEDEAWRAYKEVQQGVKRNGQNPAFLRIKVT